MINIENIRHVPHYKIDKQKWDNTISNCPQEMIYGYSWYLDAVSPNWDGLILGDYEIFMPLTHKKKWGVEYLYAPPGIGQLGIFALPKLDTVMCDSFIKAIPKRFKLIEIDLNFSNQISTNFTLRNNYILPLNAPYEKLFENYHRLAKRKLKLAKDADLTVIEDFPPDIILKTAYETLHQKTKFTQEYVKIFTALVNIGKSKGVCKSYGVVDRDENLLASDIFFIGTKRISSVIAGNKAEGNSKGAFYMVLDKIIQDYSNTNLMLDFEGSDIEGIAFLFKNLGAQLEKYPHYKINNLPWPISVFK